MAIFNPDIPEPRLATAYTRSIEQPKAYSALGEAISGGARAAGEAVKSADEIVRAFAEDDALRGSDRIKNDYIARLAGADFKMKFASAVKGTTSDDSLTVGGTSSLPEGGGGEGGATGGERGREGEAPSLIRDEAKPIPPGLKQLPGQLGTLVGARESGKISETDYFGRLMSMASDIRSRYPIGYRQYIDAEIHKITGVEPANAYLKSLIGDINSATTNLNKQREHVESALRRSVEAGIVDDVPASEMLRQFQRGGKSEDQVWAWINQQNAYKAKADIILSGLKVSGALTTEAADMHARKFTDLIASGIAKDFDTIDSITAIPDSKAPDYVVSEVERLQAGDKLVQAKLKRETDLLKLAAASGTLSVIDGVKGKGETQKMIREQLSFYDEYKDMIYNDKYGQARWSSNMFKAMTNDDKFKLIRDKDSGWAVRAVHAIESTGGSEYTKEYFKQLMGVDKPKPSKTFLDSIKIDAAAQTDPKKPTTLASAKADLIKAGYDIPSSYESLIDFIFDPKIGFLGEKTSDGIKRNLAIMMFHPDGRGFIEGLAKDQVDPNNPLRMIKGGESLFRNMTTLDVAKEMHRLASTPGNADLWGWYSDWTKLTNRNLFSRDMRDMRDRFTALPEGSNLHWSSEDHKFELFHKGAPYVPVKLGMSAVAPKGTFELNEIWKGLSRINRSMESMSNMAKVQPGVDVNTYVLQVLQSEGVDLTKVSSGIPRDMMEAIINANKERDIEENARARRRRQAGER